MNTAEKIAQTMEACPLCGQIKPCWHTEYSYRDFHKVHEEIAALANDLLVENRKLRETLELWRSFARKLAHEAYLRSQNELKNRRKRK